MHGLGFIPLLMVLSKLATELCLARASDAIDNESPLLFSLPLVFREKVVGEDR